MLLSLILISVISIGGMALTYIFADDEPLLWRLSAGCVIASAITGTAGFVLSSFFGLNAAVILAVLAFNSAPLLLLSRGTRANSFRHDWAKAKGKMQGANFAKFLRFSYYVFFLLLFIFFFDRAMIFREGGIYTGGSQNLGDLPFHLGAIFSFTDGTNFPPGNPNFAGVKFTYPFIADLLAAMFVKLGADVRSAMFVQNAAWAFSLLVILESFVFKMANNRTVSRIAPFLFFFSGGLGFILFFGDYWSGGVGFFEILRHLPNDYTINEGFRWGNSMVTLFMTQRSLLIGMPLTLVVLGELWRIFTTDVTENTEGRKHISSIFRFSAPVFVGLLAGLLPLVHLHSLAVLFVVGAFLLLLKADRWREWMLFAGGVAVIAIPEIIWSLSGSATRAGEFFAWHFGWDARGHNFIWFWLKNTGIALPLIATGVYLLYIRRGREEAGKQLHITEKEKKKGKTAVAFGVSHPGSLLLFYLPFAFLFIVSNIAKLAPWEWDNVKVLIYWYVGSIPLIAIAISWLWGRGAYYRIAAAVFFVSLIFSGGLDVWRTVSGQTDYKVFDEDAVIVANRIKATTRKDSIFLNAPTYNSAIVLSGRSSLMRYPGHLGSHGIDYGERESDVKAIYRGGADAEGLLRKYGIDYVLVSPEERNTLAANENFFRKYPVIAESGQYRVYRVRNE